MCAQQKTYFVYTRRDFVGDGARQRDYVDVHLSALSYKDNEEMVDCDRSSDGGGIYIQCTDIFCFDGNSQKVYAI
jgi:hypothetical protein